MQNLNFVSDNARSSNVQTIPKRQFSINFRNGFIVATNAERCRNFIQNPNNSEIFVGETESEEQAYWLSVNHYVQSQWQQNPYSQPLLPRLEDVRDRAYYSPIFNIAYGKIQSFIAIYSLEYMAIYDTTNKLMDFLDYFQPIVAREFFTYYEALQWLNEVFVLPMLCLSAYSTEPTLYIKQLTLNKAVKFNYKEIWNQQWQSINNIEGIPFQQRPVLADPMKPFGL